MLRFVMQDRFTHMSKEIESFINSEQWGDARALILEKLVTESQSHWLWTRLSLTYYEQYDYEIPFFTLDQPSFAFCRARMTSL